MAENLAFQFKIDEQDIVYTFSKTEEGINKVKILFDEQLKKYQSENKEDQTIYRLVKSFTKIYNADTGNIENVFFAYILRIVGSKVSG